MHTLCKRCRKTISEYEYCWYCMDPLCVECWDEFGHCGHKEADEANEKARDFNKR